MLTEQSLPPREAWIEIDVRLLYNHDLSSRFPRRKRGLKSDGCKDCPLPLLSLPPREAWIEIL